MKICEKCNHPNNDGAQICIKCHASLKTNESTYNNEPNIQKNESKSTSFFSINYLLWFIIDTIVTLIIIFLVAASK